MGGYMRETVTRAIQEKSARKLRFPRLRTLGEGLLKTAYATVLFSSLIIPSASALASPQRHTKIKAQAQKAKKKKEADAEAMACRGLGRKAKVDPLIRMIHTGDEEALKTAARRFNPIIDCLLSDTSNSTARVVGRFINNVRSLLKSRDEGKKIRGLNAFAQVVGAHDLLRDNHPAASLPVAEALSAILALMDSKNEAARAFAVKQAGDLSAVFWKPDSGEPKKLFRKLETLLDEAKLGYQALVALDSYGYEYYNEPLLKKIISGGNLHMAPRAFEMLFSRNSDPPDHAIIPYIVTLLGSPTPQISSAAKKALGNDHFWTYVWQFNRSSIGRTKSELTALTKHKNENVRKAAAELLSNKFRLKQGN